MNKEDNKISIDAAESLIRDLNALMKKVYKSKVKKEKFVTLINGDEYHTYNEILEAYGCDMITESQKDNALRKYYDWECLNVNTTLEVKINLIGELIVSLSQMIQRKRKELENESQKK